MHCATKILYKQFFCKSYCAIYWLDNTILSSRFAKWFSFTVYNCACKVGTVGKISDCQPGGPGLKPRPGRGLNFGRPSFATPSVDRDVKPLV